MLGVPDACSQGAHCGGGGNLGATDMAEAAATSRHHLGLKGGVGAGGQVTCL